MIKCPKCDSTFVVIEVQKNWDINIKCEECSYYFILNVSCGYLNKIIQMWNDSYKEGEENVKSI